MSPGRPLQTLAIGRLVAPRSAEHVFDGVALADLELVRLLERCINAPASGARARRTANLPRPCAEIAERINDGYRRVITRGASPRERASVLENLDCLVILLGQDLPALRKALEEIRDAL